MSDSTADTATALTPTEAAGLLIVSDDTQVTEPLPAGSDEPEAVETDADPRPEDEAEYETDESETSEDQPEQEAVEPEPKHRVKIAGEEVEVTYEELLKGYSREADYTRKAQTLAEQRKAAEAEFQAVRAEREHYAKSLAEVQEALNSQKLPEVDWDKLYQEDPVQYTVQRERYRQHQEAQQAVQSERQRLHEQMVAEQRQHLAEHIRAESARLVEKIPEWSKPEIAKVEKSRIAEYAKNIGYSEQEIGQIYDSRAVALMRKAMLYDELQSRKPVAQRKIESAPKMVTPGTPQRQNQKNSDKTRLQQRLAKTGSVQDAAALIMLGD
jgi:hypothetical protein